MADTTPRIEVRLPEFFINQSRWKCYQDCDRMYGWEYVEQLLPDRPRKVLEIGAAVHKAQVVAFSRGGTAEAYVEATQVAAATFRERMGAAPLLPGDEAEVQDGVAVIRRLLPAYHAHYKALGQQWKPLGLEVKFCVEVGEGTNVWLVGRIDNLVTFMQGLWLVDYKTMGRLDLRDFLKYELDTQLTAYIYGGTKQLSLEARAQGKPPVIIRGAIIDGMVKTQVPQFHRELYTRSIEELRDFEIEFCLKAWEIAAKHAVLLDDRAAFDAFGDRIYHVGQQHGWKALFPKNTNHCFRYGTCAWRDLCAKDTAVRRCAFKYRDQDYVDEMRPLADRLRMEIGKPDGYGCEVSWPTAEGDAWYAWYEGRSTAGFAARVVAVGRADTRADPTRSALYVETDDGVRRYVPDDGRLVTIKAVKLTA